MFIYSAHFLKFVPLCARYWLYIGSTALNKEARFLLPRHRLCLIFNNYKQLYKIAF